MSFDDNYEYIFKIIIIGNSNVGKTSLINRFIDKTYNENYTATLGVDFFMKTIVVNQQTIKLQIWDTAGMEKYQSITSSYYKGAHACIIVYDITDRESFDSTEKWIESFYKFCNPEIEKIILLIGNKCDLSMNRKVSFEEAENFAVKNNLFYQESSAKDSINIEEIFQAIGMKLLKIHAGNKNSMINKQHASKISENYTKIITPELKIKGKCCKN
jgi:Ras-related protein Rab-1A